MSGELRAGGGSFDNADLYNEMLLLEEMESLLEEIEESEGDATTGLPADLQSRLDSLSIADPRELRHHVELLHSSLDIAE